VAQASTEGSSALTRTARPAQELLAIAVPCATVSDPEPYSFSVNLRPSEGLPEKLRYEYGTDRRLKHELNNPRLITYEWDTKRGKTIPSSS